MLHFEDPATKSMSKEELAKKGFAWANQAGQNGDWPEAAARWAVLRAAYPDHPATWFQAIAAHIEANQTAQAEALYRTASKKFPKHPHAFIQGAKLAIHRSDPHLAKDLLRQAREKHPDVLECWLESARLDMAEFEAEEADAYLNEAMTRFPQNPQILSEYAKLAMQRKEWDEAQLRWKNFRDSFPHLQYGFYEAANAAEQQGDSKLARKLRLAVSHGTEILELEKKSTRTVRPSRRRHSSISGLAELVLVKALFNLRSEVQRSYFGYLWWGLEPLLHMGVYYVVFAELLGGGRKDYPIFLLTGLVPWMWFMKSVITSSNSIINNHGLMMQVNVPVLVFPLVSIFQVALKQLVVFLCFFMLLWILDYQPQQQLLAALPLFLTQAFITIAASTGVAAVIPFIRDLNYLVPTGLTFMMFLSGIFYDVADIDPEWQEIFMYNPMAYLIDAYRSLFIDKISLDYITIIHWLLISIGLNICVFYIFKRLQHIYPRVVMQ